MSPFRCTTRSATCSSPTPADTSKLQRNTTQSPLLTSVTCRADTSALATADTIAGKQVPPATNTSRRRLVGNDADDDLDGENDDSSDLDDGVHVLLVDDTDDSSDSPTTQDTTSSSRGVLPTISTTPGSTPLQPVSKPHSSCKHAGSRSFAATPCSHGIHATRADCAVSM